MRADDFRHGSPRFPTTQWSLVRRAADGGDSSGALEELLKRYLPSLKAHLASRGVQQDEAEDVVQAFVLDKVVSGALMSYADQRRGRFRTFLLNVLDNYLSNYRRHARAKARRPDRPVVDANEVSVVADRGPSPSSRVEITWANDLVREAVRRMEAECRQSGAETTWGVFEARVLQPALGESVALDYRDLVKRFGFRSPSQAHNQLATAKRMFIRNLRSVVAEYARDEAEIDEEIRDLKRVLLGGA